MNLCDLVLLNGWVNKRNSNTDKMLVKIMELNVEIVLSLSPAKGEYHDTCLNSIALRKHEYKGQISVVK